MLSELPDNHDIGHLVGILSKLSRFGTALDIGAHRGIWTAQMVNRFDNVIAFEPTSRYRQITDKAKVYNLAVGDKIGLVSMRDGHENTGQSHVIQGDEINIITIDSLKLTDVDFIKIDVEGMEHNVISGAINTIKKYLPAVMIEENGLCERYGHKWGDAGRLLESMGYRESGRWNKDYLYMWAK